MDAVSVRSMKVMGQLVITMALNNVQIILTMPQDGGDEDRIDLSDLLIDAPRLLVESVL